MLGYFFQLPLGGSSPVQSFMLASKTERFWCFAALLYGQPSTTVLI